MAHITRRTTADGKPRWDVRWNALGRWQTKTTFTRRQNADAFRRKIEADGLRGMVVDVRPSRRKLLPASAVGHGRLRTATSTPRRGETPDSPPSSSYLERLFLSGRSLTRYASGIISGHGGSGHRL